MLHCRNVQYLLPDSATDALSSVAYTRSPRAQGDVSRPQESRDSIYFRHASAPSHREVDLLMNRQDKPLAHTATPTVTVPWYVLRLTPERFASPKLEVQPLPTRLLSPRFTRTNSTSRGKRTRQTGGEGSRVSQNMRNEVWRNLVESLLLCFAQYPPPALCRNGKGGNCANPALCKTVRCNALRSRARWP